MNLRKDQMHPDDRRNLFIFFFAAILLYFAYNHFIVQPREAALRQQRLIEAAKARETRTAAVPVLSREEALQGDTRLPIENGKIFGSLNLTGSRIDDIAFHDYYTTLEKKENVELLSPRGTEFPRGVEYGWTSSGQNIPLPGSGTRWQVRGNRNLGRDNPVTLVWDNGQGLHFEHVISIDDRYMFAVTQRVVNNSGRAVTLYPYALISQTGIPPDYQKIWFMHEGPIGWIGDQLAEITYQDLRSAPQSLEAFRGWSGVTDKYWLTGLVPPQGVSSKYSFTYTGEPKGPAKQGLYQVDFAAPAITLQPGQSGESASHLFTGPKRVLMLHDYSKTLEVPNFDLAVDFGWLWFLSKPFFYAMHFLGEFTGNLGVAIIILTILIRGAAFPLTNASYKSFAKMKKVSPQVAELRKKHGDDKKALQQELVKVYEREGVNPMAGCFPILLQIPIFFALYKTFYTTIEVRHAPFFGWIKDLSAPDPTNIFNLFGLIDWNPPAFLHIGIWPCLMLAAMLVQRNLSPPPQDPIQRDMQRYYPFLIAYMLSKFASGLVVYWTFSAVIGIVQQVVIMRGLGVPIHLFGQTEEEKKLDKAVAEGPSVHPLAEMAEERVEDALFGDHENGDRPAISPPKRKKKKKK